MLSVNAPKPISLLSKNLNLQPFPPFFPKLHLPIKALHPNSPFFLSSIPKPKPTKPKAPFLCSATPTPTPAPPGDLYQPFRPPPAPLPSQFKSLELDGRLEILQNRLGLWFEYAPLIPSLAREGFPPSSIEESTGITGVEQNRLVVAAQVRDSLVISSSFPADLLAAFDSGGAELLYELRFLSAQQRAVAARYIVENSLDGAGARELARAMKDFERRRGDGWESFSPVPGDCLAFMFFRQSREHLNPAERVATLGKAAAVAETEKAKLRIELEMGRAEVTGEVEKEEKIKVPVVRMKMGEVAEATSVVVLPVCDAGKEEELAMAPDCWKEDGEFGVVAAATGWRRWVVLPSWEPVAAAETAVAVAFPDARVLPWKVNRWYKEEAILLVVDRKKRMVCEDEGFYLVSGGGSSNGVAGKGGILAVEKGKRLSEMGVETAAGAVVLVVRPPKLETDDELNDEDWE